MTELRKNLQVAMGALGAVPFPDDLPDSALT
jgi:hypothetical protein